MKEAAVESYRAHFACQSQAIAYETVSYAPGSYDSILWELEKEALTTLVSEFRRLHNTIDYLDFASGTGRIISFLEPKVDSAVGIEISAAMASLARTKVKRAQIICGDITGQERILDEKFDLITAFRFFLNAEPPLRVAAMRALGERLRDESSWLIFNNHGNLWSHKLLMWPYHKLRQRRRAQPLAGNYLSHREIVRLVEEAGLKIERVLGTGVLSAKALHLVSPERLLRWERRLAFGRAAKLGGSQLYVVRRAR